MAFTAVCMPRTACASMPTSSLLFTSSVNSKSPAAILLAPSTSLFVGAVMERVMSQASSRVSNDATMPRTMIQRSELLASSSASLPTFSTSAVWKSFRSDTSLR